MTEFPKIVACPEVVPQIVYPHGPRRRVVSLHPEIDAFVGAITRATLSCSHTVTLPGHFLDPSLVLCKCNQCQIEGRFNGNLSFMKVGEDGGRKT